MGIKRTNKMETAARGSQNIHQKSFVPTFLLTWSKKFRHVPPQKSSQAPTFPTFTFPELPSPCPFYSHSPPVPPPVLWTHSIIYNIFYFLGLSTFGVIGNDRAGEARRRSRRRQRLLRRATPIAGDWKCWRFVAVEIRRLSVICRAKRETSAWLPWLPWGFR